MGWHIIGPLISVDKVWIILRDHVIYKGFKIMSYGMIGMFIDSKPRGSVFDNNVQVSYFNVPSLRHLVDDLLGHKVEAPRALETHGFLDNLHEVKDLIVKRTNIDTFLPTS